MRLQFRQALVYSAAHVILHILQVLERNRNRTALGAFLVLAGPHLHWHHVPIRQRRSTHQDDVTLSDGAFLSRGIRYDKIAGDDESMGIVVDEQPRYAA